MTDKTIPCSIAPLCILPALCAVQQAPSGEHVWACKGKNCTPQVCTHDRDEAPLQLCEPQFQLHKLLEVLYHADILKECCGQVLGEYCIQ